MQIGPTGNASTLFTQYVRVVNRAFAAHRREQPWKQLFSTAYRVIGNKRIGAAIYTDDPSKPYDFFTLGLDRGKLLILEHHRAETEIEWKLKEEHLRQVVEHPDQYVETPAQLDIGWLKKRLGVG